MSGILNINETIERMIDLLPDDTNEHEALVWLWKTFRQSQEVSESKEQKAEEAFRQWYADEYYGGHKALVGELMYHGSERKAYLAGAKAQGITVEQVIDIVDDAYDYALRKSPDCHKLSDMRTIILGKLKTLPSEQGEQGEGLSTPIANEIRDRMQYFYMKTDGSYNFPNLMDGDLLGMVKRMLDGDTDHRISKEEQK